MKKSGAETQTTGLPVKDPTDALREMLFYARKMLEKLYNIHSHSAADDDLMKIDLLRCENELLKKELSELEKMMKEML